MLASPYCVLDATCKEGLPLPLACALLPPAPPRPPAGLVALRGLAGCFCSACTLPSSGAGEAERSTPRPWWLASTRRLDPPAMSPTPCRAPAAAPGGPEKDDKALS